MKNKFGFTLAEVLITLVIVGVVAAMTIPNLIHNHEKRVWAEALKVNYQLLSDGFKRMLALEGASRLSDTTVFQSMPNSSCNLSSNCPKFYSNLGKYFSISKVTEDIKRYEVLNDPGHYETFNGSSLVLANGAVIFGGYFNKSWDSTSLFTDTGESGKFKIDVNGRKGPNTLGRDIFCVTVFDNGVVALDGSNLYKEVGDSLNPPVQFFGRTVSNYPLWSEVGSTSCLTKNETSNISRGEGCGGRIMDEGWKMTY